MTITPAWLVALLFSNVPASPCAEVTLLESTVELPPFVQPLGEKTADIHHQTVSKILVDETFYEVITQDTTRIYGTLEDPVAFQVYVNGAYVHGGIPRFDVPMRSRPAWCSLPTGVPLHP